MESPICEKYIRENGGITLEILRVDNLKKVYGKGENAVHALDGVSFSVEQGEFVAIIGPSVPESLHYFTFSERLMFRLPVK